MQLLPAVTQPAMLPPQISYSLCPTRPEEPLSDLFLQGWADRLTNAYKKSVQAIVAAGQLLIEAKAAVPHGDWARLFKGQPQAVARPMPVSQHTAEQLMRIARHPTLSNSSHGSNLPTSWRTLAELARIKPELIEVALARGRIHPEITRAEVYGLFFQWRSPRLLKKAKRAYGMPTDSINALLEAQDVLRNWALEVNQELAAPLQLSEVLSGMCWISPLLGTEAKRAPKVAHQCQCPACGDTHLDRRGVGPK